MPSHPLHTRGGIAQGAVRIGDHGSLADAQLIVIGGKTYEWDDNAAVTAGNVAVTIGADADGDIANLIAAVNADPPVDGAGLALVEAYEDTIASEVARLKATRASADGNVALTTTMTSTNIVSAATLLNGENDSVQEIASGRRVVTALDVAGGVCVIETPLSAPTRILLMVRSATGLLKAITDLITQSGGSIVIDADGATNLAATDVIDWLSIQ